ncbi:MAG TPA: PASTA domain-containing protein [Gaiellaceae bacterium]
MARIPLRIPMLVLVLTAAFLSGTAAAAAPDNDNFASAAELQGRETSASGTNKDATKEAAEPNHAGKAGGASVWYRWTAPASGKATISTCDSDFDTLLAVYTGSAVGALSEVAANDDDAGCGLASSVSFQAVKDATYRIAVDGVANDVGTYHLALRLAPPNDDYADAAALAGDQGAVNGTTAGASREQEEPDYLTRSVWYSWTAPSTGWATFEACGGAVHPALAVYTGSTLATLQWVDYRYNECADGAARIAFAATEGVSYRLVVDSYEDPGDFALAWNRNAPPPDGPFNEVEPTITGNARVGETLTGSDGEWFGTPPLSFTYSWWQCGSSGCARIPGATAKSYVPTNADIGRRLYFEVVASNAAGSDYAFSEGTAAVRSRGPLLVSPPKVNGVARVGLLVDAASGAWSGVAPIEYAYQWQQCDAAGANCRDLPGELGIVFEVGRAHVGSRLRVVVTATNVDGSVSAASEPSAVVPAPRATKAARCVVPNVRGRTLARAKARIRRAGCKTGSVRRSFSSSVRRGRVVSQTPRAGARVRRGAKVSLVLSKGARR